MTTDTPTTTVDPKQIRILVELVAAHNEGEHADRPRTGCPGCFLSQGKGAGR